MPLYSFHCHACGKDFEKVIPERDRNHVSCPDCGAKAEPKDNRTGGEMIKVDNVDAIVWCRNGRFCLDATHCDQIECSFKKKKTEILEGIRQCGTFQITLPSNLWECAVHLENDFDKIHTAKV